MATTLSASKSATHTTGHLVHVSPIPVRFPLQCLRRLWWGQTEAQLAGEVKGLAQGLELFRNRGHSVTQQACTESQKMMSSCTQVLAVLSDYLGRVTCPSGLHLLICTMGLSTEYEHTVRYCPMFASQLLSAVEPCVGGRDMGWGESHCSCLHDAHNTGRQKTV